MDPNATVQLNPAKAKSKVLLVEDEVNIAHMVEDWLSEKYDVVVANTGKQALEKALSEKPDIILEDINLPDMVGFDVVKILEKDSKTNQIPVIFLTGEKMVEETVRFISTVKNVKGYVNKPFRLKDFLEKIDAILSHKSDFVVLERRPSTTESTGKADLVRETRAQSARAADEEEKRPPLAVPPARGSASKSAAAAKSSGKGFFGKLVGFLVKSVFQSLFLLAVFAGGVELACRYAETFTGEWMFLPPMTISGSGAPASLAPGSAWEQNGVRYGVNSLGLRDAEVEPAGSTDTFRVAVLGGTAIFGRDVPLDQTVSKKLEEFLKAAPLFPSGSAYRVIHAAQWGLSPEDQWAAYQGLEGRLRPDMVVWVAGDGVVRSPLPERLRMAAAWPSWMREVLRASRAADLAATCFLYEWPQVYSAPAGDLSQKVLSSLDANPRTALMVMKLGSVKGLEGLASRPNLMVFGLGKSLEPDTDWRGLSARGHAALAKTVHSLLGRHKDRLRPSEVSR